MAKRPNPYPLRLDEIVLQKAKYIAKKNSRSLNKEIEFLLKTAIEAHEEKYGEIPVALTEYDLQ